MTPHASITPIPTLAEMREHAQEALSHKPVRLDVELLARDVLELVRRVEELEREVDRQAAGAKHAQDIQEEAESLLEEAQEVLIAVRDWTREGKGTEADAAEKMDAFLAKLEAR